MADYTLLSGIQIRGTIIDDGRLCPRIDIIGPNVTRFRGRQTPGSYHDIRDTTPGDEYIILERYRVDRKDPAAMARLNQVIQDQMMASPFYSISSKNATFTAVYMSAATPMSSISLGQPDQISLQSLFLSASDFRYTDTVSDIDTDLYQYCYRIIYRIYLTDGSLCDGASNYVAGVISSDFVDSGLVTNDGTSFSLFSGSGSMYSKTNNGTIVIKGMPSQLFSPRYRGPIEAEKAAAARQQFDVNCAFISTGVNQLRTEIAQQIDILRTSSMTGYSHD